LQPPKYRHRRNFVEQDDFMTAPVRKSGLSDILPYVFGGAMLVAAFGFAGHQIGWP
jgi:hypothetical protein